MTKISELTTATSLADDDTILVSDGGVDKAMAISDLRSFLSTNTYTRPEDWLAMPADAANTMSVLVAVWPDDTLNYVGLNMTVTGGYTVDWGDGTAPENVASGVQANHNYTYADADLAGTETSRDYKQAIITITTQAANPFTTVNFAAKNASLAATQQAMHSYLDMQLNIPSCTTLTIRSSTCNTYFLERVNFTALGAITTMASLFASCQELREVTFPSGSLASVTSMASAFQTCPNLLGVAFPAGSLVNVTTLSSAFNGCYRLTEVSFPSGSLGAVTTMADAFASCRSLPRISFPAGSLDATLTNLTGTFNGCASLTELTFPTGSLSAITSLASTFTNCWKLTSLEFPSGSLSAITSLASAFANCNSLESVTWPTGSLGSCTNLSSTFSGCLALKTMSFPASSLPTASAMDFMFSSCSSLETVSFPSGALNSMANISFAFSNCISLREITFPPGWNPASMATTTSAFNGCARLSSITDCKIKVSFSVASCNLGAAALDAIYTALPTAAQTITVFSNYDTPKNNPTITTTKTQTMTGS